MRVNLSEAGPGTKLRPPRGGVSRLQFEGRRPALWWLSLIVMLLPLGTASAAEKPTSDLGTASWYGEEHRGKRMANGHRFDPDKLTAASWFYPLGTNVRVSISSPG